MNLKIKGICLDNEYKTVTPNLEFKNRFINQQKNH